MILEELKTTTQIAQLTDTQCKLLCGELRDFLVQNVSKTGGHLASNLGVTELTVAIHRVFDTSRDRLVFDVGHQSYVHKALTGRAELFSTLRQFEGLSGFPKPYESVHDAFVAGHASASVSVALGMARARTLLGEDYHVLALIGDGALGGGLAFEGLNDGGSSGEQLIVILNDNGMSIKANVGAVARHLKNLRNKPGYGRIKNRYRHVTAGNAVGRWIYRFTHSCKTAIKKWVLPAASLFEDMGYQYMGPYDGHDVVQLTQALRIAKERKVPVVVHVQTVKGKGYSYAEQDPGKFHGIGAFDPVTGELLKKGGKSFSDVFGEELAAIAQENSRVCGITAGMEDGTGLGLFAETFTDRYFDVGIAEGHAVAMAGGMAKQGMIPVFAVYSTFLQRGYDQLLHDVSLDDLHVVFGVDRAGLVGNDGETHHGVFDVAYLSEIPHMTVLCPSSFAELRAMLRYAVDDCTGPVAVRYPRGGEGRYTGLCGSEAFTELRQGSDVTLLSYGPTVNNVLDAAEALAEKNISARVVKLNRIAPLDDDKVAEVLGGTKLLLVAEDTMWIGSVGQRIASMLPGTQMILQNLGETVPPQGTVAQLERLTGLDAQSIVRTIEEVLHGQ